MEKKSVAIPMLLAFGAAAFYIMVLKSKENALKGQFETTKVLSARVDIPERTVLKEDMVEQVEVPR
jgi:hypothetical protein